MTISQIAQIRKRLSFMDEAGKEFLFDPAGFPVDLSGNRLQLTKELLAKENWQIICDHPTHSVEVSVSRGESGIIYQCGACEQRLRVKSFETYPPQLPDEFKMKDPRISPISM